MCSVLFAANSETGDMATPTSQNGHKESEQAGYFRQFHDEAYQYVEQAITLDEQNKTQEAISLYEKGLRLLEQGLAFPCEGDDSRNLRSKMNKTKDEVLARLTMLTVSCNPPQNAPEAPTEQPPSYEEACSASHAVLSSSKSTGDLERLAAVPEEAELVFTIPSGAQLFFVSVEGYVSAPSYPTSLSLYRFRPNASSTALPDTKNRPPAFLQIGQWTYPLYPGRSPVLHSSYGAFMFPDTNSTKPGAAVGLLLDEKDVDANTRRIFEHLICELTVLRGEDDSVLFSQENAAADKLSSRLSEGLVQGATMLSQGVAYGAEKTTYLVKLGAEKLRERISPEDEPLDVDPRILQGAKIARDVSGVAVKVSGYIVSRLGAATMALGRHLAPHVRNRGSQLLRAFSHDSAANANSTMDGILEVASGGLQGFSTIYLSLESAAIILARNLADETVQLVNYKYGDKAGATANDALYAAGNLAVTAHNVNALGVKAIAKRTAKNAGKAMVEDYERNKQGGSKPDDNEPEPPK